jgi:hypothetical protein
MDPSDSGCAVACVLQLARQTRLSGLVAGLLRVVLIGYSIFLGNLPSRLIQPDRFVSRYACALSWFIWGVGAILICLSSVFSETLYLILLDPVGAALGFMFCQWVCRKGILAWIQ